MSILKVLLLLFFLFMASDSQEGSPDCTGLEDFKNCSGNAENFCPGNIACQCKNQKPFCRCDYYRLDWQEYWYMGPKCNHLWNTLNFILVTVIPPVVLVIILVVIFFSIYSCKSGKAAKKTSPPDYEAQHNPAFTAEIPDNMGHGYQQSHEDVWNRQIPKVVLKRQDFDDVPRQLGNYSPTRPQPFESPDPAADYMPNQRPQFDKFGSPSNNVPYSGYAEGRPYRQY